MPLYQFTCTNCDDSFERLLKMSDMETPLSEPCPNCDVENSLIQDITSANFGDPIRMGIKRPDSGWGDVLQKVKKAHPTADWANKKFNPTGGR